MTTIAQDVQPTKQDLLRTYAELSVRLRAATTPDALKSDGAAMLHVLNALAQHNVTPQELRNAREGKI